VSFAFFGQAQGTFQNLDFEGANPSGYTPGSRDLPTTSGFPGWTVSYSSPGFATITASTVWYDGISLGSAFVSINDMDTGGPVVVFQGTYSALLYGGPSPYFSLSLTPTSSTLSQTGLIPTGTLSLRMDVNAVDGFAVTLGGQTLDMVALQVFSSYTLYGANISGFSGQTEQLSITAPPTASPNEVELDDIVFSPSPIPEPGVLGLSSLGVLLLACRCRGRLPKR
jgi:hypothetical protein